MGPAQPVPIRCWGYSLFYCIILLFANVFINFSAFCLFYLYFYSVSLPKVSPGGFCAFGTRDVTSDWVSPGPLLAHPGLCYLPDVDVYTAAPVASSDRLLVAVALSSSL